MAETANILSPDPSGPLGKVSEYLSSFIDNRYRGTAVGDILDSLSDERGKMIRPRVLLLAGEFGPGGKENLDRICKLGAMVELTHLASLIHDDIVDDAPMRRGRPSIQAKYGKNAAVYAGDYLMSCVSLHVAEDGLNRAGAIISNAVREMCAGEIGQTTFKYISTVTIADYLRNIHGKTAALFMAACRIGAEESGCDEKTAGLLERFGEILGLLFQLRDDLLDFTVSTRAAGKETHKDFLDGIYTMPVICAMETRIGRKKLQPIMTKNLEGTISEGDIALMEQIVIDCGGVEAARKEISRLKDEAESILASLPHIGASDTLSSLIAALCEV